jgi:hypothetical protein
VGLLNKKIMKVLYEFNAINQSLTNSYFVLPIVIATICFANILFFWQYKRLDSMRRNVVIMVFTFIGLTALGAGVFKFASMQKLTPIKIYADAIETPYGKIPFADLKDASVQPYIKFKPMQSGTPADSSRYLFLFKHSQNLPDVISEGDYKIDSIFDALRQTLTPPQ